MVNHSHLVRSKTPENLAQQVTEFGKRHTILKIHLCPNLHHPKTPWSASITYRRNSQEGLGRKLEVLSSYDAEEQQRQIDIYCEQTPVVDVHRYFYYAKTSDAMSSALQRETCIAFIELTQ